MKKITILLLVVFLPTSIFCQNLEPHSPKHLIVKFKAEVAENLNDVLKNNIFGYSVLDNLNQSHKLSFIKLIGNKSLAQTYVLGFEESQNIQVLIDEYLSTQLFEYVEPNYIGKGAGVQGTNSTIPNDFRFPRQWGLVNDGTFSLSPATVDADVDMDLAWDIEKGDSTLVVAVLDAGLKLDHPEFEGRLWINAFDTVDGLDEDGNGFIDDINGWDFANDDNLPKDDHGHGTNVTGIIAAKADNSIGFAGADWHCKVMTGKILDANNLGLYSWFAEGIYYAVDNGARLINMSVGGSGFSQVLSDAVDYAHQNGVTIIACMMNVNNQVTYYPAGYSKTIAVGSTNSNDERTAPFFWDATSGSNFGSHIDVVAPGNYIYGLSHSSNHNYNSYWGGTSQAAPLVTGICALLLAQDPLRQPEDLRNILRNTAEDEVGDPSEDIVGYDIYYGAGRVNAFEALKLEAVGLKENLNLESQIQVYPNPVQNILKLNSTLNYSRITLANSMGSIVLEKEVTSNSKLQELNVAKMPKGMYILSMLDTKGNILGSKKVLIGL